MHVKNRKKFFVILALRDAMGPVRHLFPGNDLINGSHDS